MRCECPTVDFDPYSDAMLRDPFAAYESVRALGPVVRLNKYDCWAVFDYDLINEVLQDPDQYSSAAGVGVTNYHVEKPWHPKSIILETDPPEHDRARDVLSRVLSRLAMEKMRQDFAAIAEVLVSEVVAKGDIDAVPELAEKFPLSVFPDALGLVREGRENLLPWGSIIFNSHGPKNHLWHAAIEDVETRRPWIMQQCLRQSLDRGGLGSAVYEAVDSGEISESEAGMLVRSLLSAGLDTTVNGIAAALYCFAAYPDQWQLLREKPRLVRGAINEVLRYQGAVLNFFRTTTTAVTLGGVKIPEKQKVLVLFAAGNRDPKKWGDPENFRIERNASDHLGFGAGVHKCVGQMVARLEIEIILDALLQTVERMEHRGEPKIRLNNSLRGFSKLPIRFHSQVKCQQQAIKN